MCGETYPKTEPILWLNMRQEPSLYVNGEPVCARPTNKVRTECLFVRVFGLGQFSDDRLESTLSSGT